MNKTIPYLILCISLQANAQNNTTNTDKLLAISCPTENTVRNNCYFNNWQQGVVKLHNGAVVTNELIRYNAVTDELIWLRKPDLKMGQVCKPTITEFTLLNETGIPNATFERCKIKSWYATDSVYTYLQVLAKGTLTLYVQRKIIVSNNTTAEVIKQNAFYYKSNGILYGFSPNKLSLFWNLKTQKQKLKEIIKDYKLDIGNETELIELFSLYNR